MALYDRRDLKRLFGISVATLRVLEKCGYLASAHRGHYEFQDLLLFRTVGSLHTTLSSRALYRALRQLKPWLSAHDSISRLSLRAVHNGITARDGSASWEPTTGQYCLPLEATLTESQVVPMKKRSDSMKKTNNAHVHYLRGADLEDADLEAAKAAYHACLHGDCTHLEARINLGRLLHLEGRHAEAESVYRGTTASSPVLFFNLGVLLEDLQRVPDAMAAYRNAIAHDPGFADAHLNLSLLHEGRGESQAAFRHLLAYRRLSEPNASRKRAGFK